MGGKSRKSGGASKKLIERLKRAQAQRTEEKVSGKKEKKNKKGLFDEEK